MGVARIQRRRACAHSAHRRARGGERGHGERRQRTPRVRALQSVFAHGQIYHFHGNGHQRDPHEHAPPLFRTCAERRRLRHVLHRQMAFVRRTARASLRHEELLCASGTRQAGVRRIFRRVQLPPQVLRALRLLPPGHSREDICRRIRAGFHDRSRARAHEGSGGGGQTFRALSVAGHSARSLDGGQRAAGVSGYVRGHGFPPAAQLPRGQRSARRHVGEILPLRAAQTQGMDEGVLRHGRKPRL